MVGDFRCLVGMPFILVLQCNLDTSYLMLRCDNGVSRADIR